MPKGRPSPAAAGGMLSIGALSRATGIPVETLRTWERRYGFPAAFRKPSGHRLYPLAAVSRLRRILATLTLGHRAGEIVPLSPAGLDRLLAASPRPAARGVAQGADMPSPPRGRRTPRPKPPPRGFADALAAVRVFDADRYRAAVARRWSQLAPLPFLERFLAPLLVAVGRRWQQGRLDVRHEHFASALAGDFLRESRHPHDRRARGPLVALATLAGERHEGGLLMAALVLALAGWRVVYVGADIPARELADVARETPLAAVAVSISAATAGDATRRLSALRRSLPRGVRLVIGGAGAPESVPGVLRLPDLTALDAWARSAQAPAPAAR